MLHEILKQSKKYFCTAMILFSVLPVSGQIFFGPDARTMFEGFNNDFGGSFIDFNSLPAGTALDNEFFASDGVSFASTIGTNGVPFSTPHNMVVSIGFPSRAGWIVGTPFTCCDDGGVGYDITFATPQRWAGLQRIWNTSTLTRFFDSSDNLLTPEHFNTVNSEFVGFVALSDDPANWIARIQIDSDSTRQVGYSDDLFFGTAAIPEPATTALLGLGLLMIFLGRRRSLQ